LNTRVAAPSGARRPSRTRFKSPRVHSLTSFGHSLAWSHSLRSRDPRESTTTFFRLGFPRSLALAAGTARRKTWAKRPPPWVFDPLRRCPGEYREPGLVRACSDGEPRLGSLGADVLDSTLSVHASDTALVSEIGVTPASGCCELVPEAYPDLSFLTNTLSRCDETRSRTSYASGRGR